MNTFGRTLLVFFLVVAGCAAAGTVAGAGEAPRDKVKVEGDRVYFDGMLFAELVYVGRDAATGACRGLAIRYALISKYEWIAPKEGWRLGMGTKVVDEVPVVADMWQGKWPNGLAVLKGKRVVRPGDDLPREWRSGIRISPDGKFVLYREPAGAGMKERKFAIRYPGKDGGRKRASGDLSR